MKNLLFCFLLLGVSLCKAQTSPNINGKPLVEVTSVQWNFAQRPAGWYRIAKTSVTLRGNATFELRENADHSTVRFEVGISYNSAGGNSFTLTNHSFFGKAIFEKIRIVSEGTYADTFLEVYVNPRNNDNQYFSAFLINAFSEGDWKLENWTNGAVPAGYTSSVFDVSQLFAVGNSFSPNTLSVSRSGFVGIGTASPTDKLSVKGNIRAQEIKVETANWPDYVFDNNYSLPDLYETEKFVKANKHLPGIPTAKEIEEKGQNVGEVNARLLQKIEELTLHVIAIQRQVDMLKKQNTSKNKRLNSQKKHQ